jgi:HD-GYP domain-containing protein (c-di-GMP phosphodiesterase class II)
MAELEKVKVDVMDLKVGLYVSALDRPWSQTSFPLQGFKIRSHRELSALKAVCQYVYIDSEKSNFDSDETRQQILNSSASDKRDINKVRKSTRPLDIDHNYYGFNNNIPSSSQYQQVNDDLIRVSSSINAIYSELRAGSDIDEAKLNQASSILTDAIVKMPTAAFWTALLQQHDDQIYNHGLRTATWALLCGRHIGLEVLQLKRLAQGILLKDVYRLSGKFNTQAKADPVLTSVSLLRESNAHPKIIAVVKYHRERFNGSGKPFGLVGEKIPFLARIASIATAYDLALHPLKDQSKAKSPSQAAKVLYNQKGKAFQEELVVEFIEAIGLYPLGTMVTLSSGETGVVIKNNPNRRLKPEIMVVKDANGSELEEPRTINLSSEEGLSITNDLPAARADAELQNVFENSVLSLVPDSGKAGGGFIKRLFGTSTAAAV